MREAHVAFAEMWGDVRSPRRQGGDEDGDGDLQTTRARRCGIARETAGCLKGLQRDTGAAHDDGPGAAQNLDAVHLLLNGACTARRDNDDLAAVAAAERTARR